MNRQIKELAAKADISIDKYGMAFANRDHNEDGVDLELFAKLLIEECAVAAELAARTFSDGDAGLGCYTAANTIRCFGRDDEPT